MVVFPNCKINLGLNIIRKRNDGFHDLETVFYPVGIKDAIEVIENERTSNVRFSTSGLAIDHEQDSNLCVRAYDILKKDFPRLPSIEMHLLKSIPIGAGLGGGSADGAFTLKLLNNKFGLSLTQSKLEEYALQMGSDCPFFIRNKPCFATGRGELLEEIELDLSGYKILIVHPGIHVSTASAFATIKPGIPVKSPKEIVQQPISTWRKELVNDFEATVFNQYPEIKKIKENLYSAGALYASMSGSGSSVYGIFQKDKKRSVTFPSNYVIKELAC